MLATNGARLRANLEQMCYDFLRGISNLVCLRVYRIMMNNLYQYNNRQTVVVGLMWCDVISHLNYKHLHANFFGWVQSTGDLLVDLISISVTIQIVVTVIIASIHCNAKFSDQNSHNSMEIFICWSCPLNAQRSKISCM